MFKDQIRNKHIIILSLWVLLIFWVRPWSGDLRSDPLTYACISKDMVENNNWLSPQFNGRPYLNKPPLYFWLVGLSFKIFGVSFYATKIPSLLIGTACAFLLYFLVDRLFKNKELAFFSTFVFISTHWIFKNFTTNRPESLLVFSVLLGIYGFVLLREEHKFSGVLLGLSFAIGFMTKIFFALFMPLIITIYGLLTKEIFLWFKKRHIYLGAITGISLASPWFIYYEGNNPGYLGHLLFGQTLYRFKEGGDVIVDSLMYLKELVIFYQPWLLFFILGLIFLLHKLKKRKLSKNEMFIFIGFVLIFIILQVSKGKAARYLTVVTPFISIITGIGIISLKQKFREFLGNIVFYGWIPLFIIFWIIPVRINPEKHYVVHIARQIAAGKQGDYRNPLAFLNLKKIKKAGQKIIFLSSPALSQEDLCLYYFYLSDLIERWDYSDVDDWFNNHGNGIIIMSPASSVESLRKLNLNVIEIARDQYFMLAGIYKNK